MINNNNSSSNNNNSNNNNKNNTSHNNVQASHDRRACYGVSKCADIVLERSKMVRGEGLEVLEERMKMMTQTKMKIISSWG